jgi:hypothetical protein
MSLLEWRTLPGVPPRQPASLGCKKGDCMAGDPVNEAIALIRAGRMAEAQMRLEPFIEANPHHIAAWIQESDTWQTPQGKIRVLELALQHNPGQPQLLSALAALQPPKSVSTQEASAVSPAGRSAAARPAPDPRRLVNVTLLGGAVCAVIWVGLWMVLSRPVCESSPKGGTTLHVLFIGNSYTFVNDLPTIFSELACSGGYRTQTGMAAPGAWTLAQHANSADTLGKLNQQPWDFVVLQEQSQVPANAVDRSQTMYPAVRQLVMRIRLTSGTPLLFMTWGHRDGWPEAGLPDYSAMQAQLSTGYLGIAHELNVAVAPVGAAWLQVRTQVPDLSLWQDDGSHPTAAGTYLAACVFYAAVFRQSPAGLPFHAGLPQETAARLQSIAADTVLRNPAEWGLH